MKSIYTGLDGDEAQKGGPLEHLTGYIEKAPEHPTDRETFVQMSVKF